jgi:hypothetical protein
MSRWYTLNSQTGIYSGPLIDALRLGLAGVGLSTVAWAFTTPSPPPSEPSSSDLPSDARSTASAAREPNARAVSTWMRRASEEGKDGTSVATALENVGPWAKDQRAGDNAVPARAPSSSSSRHHH